VAVVVVASRGSESVLAGSCLDDLEDCDCDYLVLEVEVNNVFEAYALIHAASSSETRSAIITMRVQCLVLSAA
jgi:hypothetical protein